MFFKKKTTTRPAATVTTRVVAEKRWVHRNQIEMGMYVHELDRPWTDTRFMFQGFIIDTPELLLQVQESCEHASVQTEKVALVSSNSTTRMVGATRNR